MPLHILPVDNLVSKNVTSFGVKRRLKFRSVRILTYVEKVQVYWSKVILQCLLHLFQSGKTPLHYAAGNWQDQSCKVLLEAGASVDIQEEVSLPLGDVEIRNHCWSFVIQMLKFQLQHFKNCSRSKFVECWSTKQLLDLVGFLIHVQQSLLLPPLSLYLSLSLSPSLSLSLSLSLYLSLSLSLSLSISLSFSLPLDLSIYLFISMCFAMGISKCGWSEALHKNVASDSQT